MSRKKPEKKEISQEWLTTYSDMVTLVLTFFVLLYSYSLVDIAKFKAAANSIATALNNGSNQMFQLNDNSKSGDAPIVGDNTKANSGQQAKSQDNDIYTTVSQFVKDNSLEKYVTIIQGNRGVYIQFNDEILFDPGKDEIKSEGIPSLNKISELISKLGNQIVIEGYTDNVPISGSKFNSNWELSAARALSVLKYMTEIRGLNPKRFSIAGYGEYSPIASNDTPPGRQKNRRVNILILSKDEDSAK